MNFEELYDKSFLRKEFIELNFIENQISIKELTFTQEMGYLKHIKNKDIIIHLLFICPEINLENVKYLTPEEIEHIFEIFEKVNKQDLIPEKHNNKNTIEFNILECIDFLASRYGKSPDEIMERFSRRLIFLWWNDIARNSDNKCYGEKQNTDDDLQAVLKDTLTRERKNKIIGHREPPQINSTPGTNFERR